MNVVNGAGAGQALCTIECAAMADVCKTATVVMISPAHCDKVPPPLTVEAKRWCLSPCPCDDRGAWRETVAHAGCNNCGTHTRSRRDA